MPRKPMMVTAFGVIRLRSMMRRNAAEMPERRATPSLPRSSIWVPMAGPPLGIVRECLSGGAAPPGV